MSYRYINRPVTIPLETYEDAVAWIGEKVSSINGFRAFYRFGNITRTGISDLDLLLVFKDEYACNLSGFENLPAKFQPVFTHGIMAISERHFAPNNYYTLWSRHSLVTGTPLDEKVETRDAAADNALHRQTAIEFLVANYIDLKVQQAYGTFKLRSLLQHMKGIGYDLNYLGLTDSPLHDPLEILKTWISNWFEQMPTDRMITNWLNNWIPLYDRFTEEILTGTPLYLPAMENYAIAGNQALFASSGLQAKRKGMLLPGAFSFIGKKYFNLQNKLNQFQFGIPLTAVPANALLAERFEFLKDMKSYNRKYLPAFMTMTTSITSKLI